MDTVVKASDEVVEDVAEEVADLTVTATTDPHGGNIDVIYSTDQVEKALEVKDIPSSPTRMPSVVDTIPDDIKDLTIRNLDTNEEYVIGDDKCSYRLRSKYSLFLHLYSKVRMIRTLNSTHLSYEVEVTVTATAAGMVLRRYQLLPQRLH